MTGDNNEYNPKFEEQAKGFAIGSHNIIYNYFGYSDQVKAGPVDVADDNLPCPYRSLYQFTPNDSDFFFGREIFVEKLFQATQNRNFIPVIDHTNLDVVDLSRANLDGAKNLTNQQVKKACNWEQADFSSYLYLDNEKAEWVVDEEKQQAKIKELKEDKASDPKEKPDCSRWKEE